MAVREFLEKVKEQNKTVDRIEEQLERTEAEITRLKSPTFGDKVQSNHQEDLSDTLIRLEERKEEKLKQLNRLLDMKESAEKMISLLRDETAKNILIYRYIEGRKWEWIAQKMKYTDTRWIQRKANNAIARIGREAKKKRYERRIRERKKLSK